MVEQGQMWRSAQGVTIGVLRAEGAGVWRVFAIDGLGAGTVFLMDEADITAHYRQVEPAA